MGAALLSGCSSGQKAVDPLAFQREAMEATDPRKAPGLAPGSQAEKDAIARFHDFFAVFDEANIRKKVRATYADKLYFNDTLKCLRDVDSLERYMVESANATESTTVEHLNTVAKDGEYYFHWRMDIRFKKFKKGTTQTSWGISHIRFDKDGRVVYHQDYWDAATHLFEKIPVVGGLIRWIKGRL